MSEEAGSTDTLGALVPLGLAGAFSWLPVTGLVVLLLARRGMTRVWAFVVGRVAGLALITAACVAGARALPAPRSTPTLEGPVVAGSMPVAEAVLAVVVYLAVAASSVLLPVLAMYVAPIRTQRWLRATQDWLHAHGSVPAAVAGAAAAWSSSSTASPAPDRALDPRALGEELPWFC